MVADRRSGPKWVLEDLPIVDAARTMPDNFSEKCLSAYMRLPIAAMPQQSCRGSANYTVIVTKLIRTNKNNNNNNNSNNNRK